MPLDKTYIKQAKEYIIKATGYLNDIDNAGYFQKTVESIDNAMEAMADNEYKHAMLEDAVTRWASQLTFILFRRNLLVDELTEEYRKLKPVEDTTAAVQKFKDETQAEIDAINEKHAEVLSRQKGIDIFQAIIGGMSAEEAKAKLEEYETKLAEAQAQGR